MRKNSLHFIASFQDLDASFISIPENQQEMVLIISQKEIISSMKLIDDQPHHLNYHCYSSHSLSILEHVCQSSANINKHQTKKRKSGCVCKKTNCLKFYCQCFQSGRICTEECICLNCCNNKNKEQVIKNVRYLRKSRKNNSRDIGCNCKKSNCQKKYCQCLNGGKKCGVHCKCIDCNNQDGDSKQQSIYDDNGFRKQ